MTALSAIAAGRAPETRDRLALIAGDVRLTYADLGGHVARAAATLAALGVGAGTRVAVIASNRPATLTAILALIELGAVLVPIHPRLTRAEADVIRANVAPCVALDDDALDRLVSSGESPIHLPSIPSEDALAIVHTSGTSGRPKGAVLSRAAFLASARASEANLGFAPRDRWLLCMPLCHVGGLSIVTRCLAARRPIVLEPRFDPDVVLASIDRNLVTIASLVPTMLRALIEHDARAILPRLRVVLVGGAATPMSLLDACASRRIAAITTYGLTEACSQVTSQSPGLRERAEAGSGHALPGVEMRISGDDGESAPVGAIGRIQLRGPTLMTGYHAEPSPLVDGWFDTGDLGALDETGTLFVHARRTDLIVTGGENVYPVEVEKVLESAGGVARALVFGAPDDRWGAVVAAAIVLEPGASLDEARLASHLAAHLALHKRPRLFAITEELPVTPAGKPDRRAAFAQLGSILRDLKPV